jgi:hypothetical protein
MWTTEFTAMPDKNGVTDVTAMRAVTDLPETGDRPGSGSVESTTAGMGGEASEKRRERRQKQKFTSFQVATLHPPVGMNFPG